MCADSRTIMAIHFIRLESEASSVFHTPQQQTTNHQGEFYTWIFVVLSSVSIECNFIGMFKNDTLIQLRHWH